MGTRRVTVSQHAIDEAIRDFRVDPRIAEDWIRSKLKKAKFIANIVSIEGKPARLFAVERIALILSDIEDTVITVYPRHNVIDELKSQVDAVVQRALRKAERQVKAAERKVAVEKARLRKEIAECEWKMTITPSKRVINANKAKIAELERKIANLDEELLRVKKEASTIAKSAVAYV